MENRYTLQFHEPQFKTWSSDNFFISTILPKDTAYHWYMNFYVNTLGVVKTEDDNAPPSVLFHPSCIPTTSQFLCNVWDLCPFVDKNTLNREIVKTSYPTFCDFVTDFVSQGYFVDATFSQTKIRGRNYSHKAYITGFDRDLQEVYLADHIDNGRFQHFTMRFDDLNHAFLEADEFIPLFDKDHQMEENSIYLIKPKDFHYEFDCGLFSQFLKNYLNSDPGTGFLAKIRNTPFRKDAFCYGLEIYEIIEAYLDKILYKPNYINENRIDDRIFTFLYDHKLTMQKRIQYLIKEQNFKLEPLLAPAGECVDYAAMCFNLYLKFGFTYRKENVERIKNLLLGLKQMDISLCTELIERVS